MASAAPHAETPSASARAPRPSFWAPFRSTDDRHSHTFSLSGKPTVKRIVQQSSNDGDKRPRCFTCSPARTFSELPGHAFVTCKTIVQSLLFRTRVVDRFLYITKVRRITTTFRSSVTRQDACPWSSTWPGVGRPLPREVPHTAQSRRPPDRRDRHEVNTCLFQHARSDLQ